MNPEFILRSIYAFASAFHYSGGGDVVVAISKQNGQLLISR